MGQVARIIPLLFAIAGAGFGICVAMLLVGQGQVHLEDSTPIAFGGVVGGGFVGIALQDYMVRKPRLEPAVSLLALALMGAAVLGPLGWIAGDGGLLGGERGTDENPRRGMIGGMLVGIIGGIAVGVRQLRADRRKPK